MDEKYAAYKKSPQYKKKILMNLFLVVILGVFAYCGYLFYQEYNGNKGTNQNYQNYGYEIAGKEVLLYLENDLLKRYKCQNDCIIYQDNNAPGYFYQGKIMLQDGAVIYLYDLLNNRKLSIEYAKVHFIYDGKGRDLANIKLFTVSDSFGKTGLMNLNGSLQVNLNYEALGNFDADGNLNNYSYSRNYITAKSGGKWGLIALNNGKGLIDFQYEDIRLSDYRKIAVKENSLWFVVDEGNKRILAKGFSTVDIYENNLVVTQDNQVFITDLLGNVISNKLEVMLPIDPWLYDDPSNGLYTELVAGKITLYIGELLDNSEYQVHEYFYDIETNQLINVD